MMNLSCYEGTHFSRIGAIVLNDCGSLKGVLVIIDRRFYHIV